MASQCHSRRSPPSRPHRQRQHYYTAGTISIQPDTDLSAAHSHQVAASPGCLCDYGGRGRRAASDSAVLGCSIVVAGSAAPIVRGRGRGRGPVFGSKGRVRNRRGGAVQDPGAWYWDCLVCTYSWQVMHLRGRDRAEMFFFLSRRISRTTPSERAQLASICLH
jgi:hypothetical protein